MSKLDEVKAQMAFDITQKPQITNIGKKLFPSGMSQYVNFLVELWRALTAADVLSGHSPSKLWRIKNHEDLYRPIENLPYYDQCSLMFFLNKYEIPPEEGGTELDLD